MKILSRNDWDPSVFITAGDHWTHPDQLTDPIRVLRDSAGYDGQFYYRLALGPFTHLTTDFGITLDNPATRMQRIGYPFLAWLVSFGCQPAVPVVLIGLNLAALFIVAWVATDLAQKQGLSPWLGLAVPLYPGFVLSLSRDTTEIVAVAFAFSALSLLTRRRYWAASVLAVLAVMTRETTLLYLAGYGLVQVADCLRRRRWSWRLVALALPAVVFMVWQTALVSLWGDGALSGTAQNIGPPFAGFVSYIASQTAELSAMTWHDPFFTFHAFFLGSAVMCVVFFALVGLGVVIGAADAGLKISWLLYLLMTICFTTAIWVEPYDYLRVCSDVFVVGATVLLLSRRRWLAGASLALTVPSWLTTLWYARMVSGN